MSLKFRLFGRSVFLCVYMCRGTMCWSSLCSLAACNSGILYCVFGGNGFHFESRRNLRQSPQEPECMCHTRIMRKKTRDVGVPDDLFPAESAGGGGGARIHVMTVRPAPVVMKPDALNLTERFFKQRFSRYLWNFKIVVCFLFVAVGVVTGFYASQIRLSKDTPALFPEDNPIQRYLDSSSASVGGTCLNCNSGVTVTDLECRLYNCGDHGKCRSDENNKPVCQCQRQWAGD